MRRYELVARLLDFSNAVNMRTSSILSDKPQFMEEVVVLHSGPISRLVAAFGSLTYGSSHPTLMFCSKKTYMKIWDNLTPQQKEKQPRGGHGVPDWILLFGVPLTWHTRSAAGIVTMLNEKHENMIKAYEHPVAGGIMKMIVSGYVRLDGGGK